VTRGKPLTEEIIRGVKPSDVPALMSIEPVLANRVTVRSVEPSWAARWRAFHGSRGHLSIGATSGVLTLEGTSGISPGIPAYGKGQVGSSGSTDRGFQGSNGVMFSNVSNQSKKTGTTFPLLHR